MKQGCLLLSVDLVAQPNIFDAVTDAFTLVRMLEIENSTDTVIFIVEHDDFLDAEEGYNLPFYDPVFENHEGEITLQTVGQPYIHSKHFIKCQKQKETPKQEREQESHLWEP